MASHKLDNAARMIGFNNYHANSSDKIWSFWNRHLNLDIKDKLLIYASLLIIFQFVVILSVLLVIDIIVAFCEIKSMALGTLLTNFGLWVVILTLF